LKVVVPNSEILPPYAGGLGEEWDLLPVSGVLDVHSLSVTGVNEEEADCDGCDVAVTLCTDTDLDTDIGAAYESDSDDDVVPFSAPGGIQCFEVKMTQPDWLPHLGPLCDRETLAVVSRFRHMFTKELDGVMRTTTKFSVKVKDLTPGYVPPYRLSSDMQKVVDLDQAKMRRLGFLVPGEVGGVVSRQLLVSKSPPK
jgi:hypothetical protein